MKTPRWSARMRRKMAKAKKTFLSLPSIIKRDKTEEKDDDTETSEKK